MERFWFKLKLHIKPIFHSLLQITFLLFFGWFQDKLFETTIIWCCFFIFRQQFEKQFHATTTWLCTIYSIGVFYLISLIAPNKAISLLLIVSFTFIINIVSFYVREFLDLKARFTKLNSIRFAKGMSIEDVKTLSKTANLTELETNILIEFYCNRKSIQNIAFRYNYSYDRIWQIKSGAITKIKKIN